MNEYVRTSDLTEADPQAPLGVSRRRFTIDELEAMDRAGIIGPDERVELLDGEIITMAAKGTRHEDVRTALINLWARRLPLNMAFAMEAAFRLAKDYVPEPDIMIFPLGQRSSHVRADTVLLVVEVADSSLSIDLKVKGPRYAAFGVREYWVIDVETLATHVHRDPGPDGYRDVTIVANDVSLVPLLAPALSLRLVELHLD
jgi:Uma2 family endonuclease